MNRSKTLLALGAALVIVISGGCTPLSSNPDPANAAPTLAAPTSTPLPPTATATAAPTPTTAAAPLNAAAVQNFTYTIGYGPDKIDKIPLKDGKYESTSSDPADKLFAVLLPQMAFGDLNGDGLADAADVIGVNGGGSGTFVHLVALTNSASGPVQSAEVFIDDRAKINSVTIENGKILLDFVGHGANDPMCCPTLHLLRTYQLKDAALEMVAEKNLP